MKRFTGFLILIFLLSFNSVFAGITGKITGRILDAKTNEALVGVNIILEGTNIGAASDMAGRFTILNVPPGTYALRFSMIGFAVLKNTDVIVRMDQTTDVGKMKMSEEVLDGEEVVIVAERPIVTRDVSASEMHFEAEAIQNLPVKTVNEVLSLQAGIQQTTDGIIIRGGDVNQTGYLLDGISLNDERSNVPNSVISLTAVEEVKVQTGGFNAEYGNIRSGVVNIITKDGERDRFTGGITFQYRPANPKNFGPSVYDPNTYFSRPYLDPAVCWTGTTNGNWDAYTQKQYPLFEGWIAVAEATVRDDDPKNDLTPEGAKRLWEWQHRRQGDIVKPDFVLDGSFGGPVPFISEKLGDLRFYLSHFREREMFIYPLARDSYEDNSTQIKLTSEISPTIKLNITGLYGEVHSVSPYAWTTTPTGYVMRSPYEVADLVNSSSGNAMLYVPGYYSPASIYRNTISLKLTHMLSPKTYYEVSAQNSINRYNTYQLTVRDTTKSYEPVPGYATDEAPYGYWGYGVSGIDGMILGGWMNLGRDKSVNSTFLFKFDLTSQINSSNEIKTGIDVVYNDYDINSYTENPSMSTWNRSQRYNRFPYRIGVYAQDKLEFQGFIANVGLRLDYSDPNGMTYVLDPFDQLYREGLGLDIETTAEKTNADASAYLSPRLGISHPITENSKLYFNYGHFTQEPSSTYRFRLQRESNGLVTSVGNPNLIFERTIAYELGYEQNLMDQYLLSIAAYYKDITDQPGWVYYENINRSVQYNITDNNNYEDIRGLELTVNKRIGAWVTGFINYTYEVSTSGYFGVTSNYEDPNKQRDYLRNNPYQTRPHPRPYARINLDFHTPHNFGPILLGHNYLGDWNLNVLANWKSGSYETYNPRSIPGIVDNVQWKDRYNIDLRLKKSIKVNRYDFQVYLEVTNVLNMKLLSYAGFSDYYDYIDYLESLHFSWEEGSEHGDDRIGEYRDKDVAYEAYDPTDPTKSEADLQKILDTKAYIDMPNLEYFQFLNPRDFKFGVKVSF